MAAPIRIGILNDIAAAPPSPNDIEYWMQLAIDEVSQAGRIDRGIEFVHSWGLGLPSGTAATVERMFQTLVDQDVLLIVGPAIGDNALIATPLADLLRTPAINWAGAQGARSDYMFHLQVGSHEDELIILARHLASLGARRIGVIYDRSVIGDRHFDALRIEAGIIDLTIAAALPVAPLADDATREVAAIVDAGIDAFLYLGFGVPGPAVASALTASGWTGPRVMNSSGIRGNTSDYGRAMDGWTYLDMHADDNRTLAALRARLGLPPRQSYAAARGYDLGRLVAEGIARAPTLTRGGVRDGLEQVKWLEAAEGYQGTLLGFGVQDRGALHGRYLVIRQWRDGQSVQVG